MESQRIKNAHFHLGLNPEMLERVRKAALDDGRTITGWIEKAISEKLEKADKLEEDI